MSLRYAYLHGFASNSRSFKGTRLAARFAEHGLTLALPDLNNPSFAELTYTGALAAIDALAGDTDRWRFVGSSMGGWLAAAWAALHPERVDRLVLLCPGFDLPRRWPTVIGAEAMARWQADGALALPDAEGVATPVWWRFIEDARTHPAAPAVPCPTLILHGTDDEVVPIASSRAYAAEHADRVSLVALDGDHGLGACIDRIGDEVLTFFGVGPGGA